jgi:hypothetical protein
VPKFYPSPFRTRRVPEGGMVPISSSSLALVVILSFASPNRNEVDDFATAIQTVISELATHKPCGWIADRRGNGGGNISAMMAGIALPTYTARTTIRQIRSLVRFERVAFSICCLFSTRVHIPTHPASKFTRLESVCYRHISNSCVLCTRLRLLWVLTPGVAPPASLRTRRRERKLR